MKTKIIFVRHGETVNNSRKILQGHTGGRLSSVGLLQAKKVAKRLSEENIDVIYSSDSTRAKQTANEIKKYHDVSIFYDKRLREKCYGVFEGKKLSELEKAENLAGKRYIFFQPKGGESYKDVQKRSSDFFKELFVKHKNKTILIVSHGNFMMLSILLLLKENVKNYEKYRHSNTGVTVLELENKKIKLKKFNCTKHLK